MMLVADISRYFLALVFATSCLSVVCNPSVTDAYNFHEMNYSYPHQSDSKKSTTFFSIFYEDLMPLSAGLEEKCILDRGVKIYPDCNFDPDCYGISCKRLGSTFKLSFDCQNFIMWGSLNSNRKIIDINKVNILTSGLAKVVLDTSLVKGHNELFNLHVEYGPLFCAKNFCMTVGLKQMLPTNLTSICKSMNWTKNIAISSPPFNEDDYVLTADFAINLSLMVAAGKLPAIWDTFNKGDIHNLFHEMKDFSLEKLFSSEDGEQTFKPEIDEVPTDNFAIYDMVGYALGGFIIILFISSLIVMIYKLYNKKNRINKNQDEEETSILSIQTI